MTGTEKRTDLQKLCLMLYGIYALSAVMQFFPQTLLLGLLTLIIAYILTRSKKEEAKGTPYASHLRWMLRTFWIGTAVIVPVAIIIASALVWNFTDITSLITARNSGDPMALMASIQNYMEENETKIILLSLITMAPTTVWWLWRCWVGYAAAREGRPVENVTSWL